MQIPSRTIQATPVAPGIAIGRVMLLHSSGSGNVPVTTVKPDDVTAELKRFHDALDITKKQLQDLREQLKLQLEVNSKLPVMGSPSAAPLR